MYGVNNIVSKTGFLVIGFSTLIDLFQLGGPKKQADYCRDHVESFYTALSKGVKKKTIVLVTLRMVYKYTSLKKGKKQKK